MGDSVIYEIRVEGFLADRWSQWFEGLTIRRAADGETVLRGPLVDQAALHGVLAKIRDLNLDLISVTRCHPERPPQNEPCYTGAAGTGEDNRRQEDGTVHERHSPRPVRE